jgi:hypothetical protein
MKKFMAVYTGSVSADEKDAAPPMDPREEASAMQAWGQWMMDHRKLIVDQGGPLGMTKRVSRAGVADTHNNIAAYVIVEAESHEAAARMFENHPHFTMFPGDGVEIMECLPVPD